MNRLLIGVTRMAGGRKASRRGTAARRLVAAGLALTCLAAVSPARGDFGSDITLKVGASGLYNHRMIARAGIVGQRQAGAHVSVDFTMPGERYALSPFLDVYHRVETDASTGRPRNDAATNMIGGANFLFTGFRSERATMYLGIGAGALRLKVAKTVRTSEYKNKLMANALMGLEVKVAPRIAAFVEPHYVWTTKILNGMSTHVGLAYRFGGAEAAPVRSAPPVYISKPPVRKAPEPMKTPEPVMTPEPVKVVEPVKPRVSSVEALATMEAMVYFRHDKSGLSDEAKAILNAKVPIFRDNPEMRIVISGFASKPGTAEYNMALGLRRAEASKAYLVSQGVDPSRILVATHGEGQLVLQGPGEVAGKANRRDQFRLLIAETFLEMPRK